MKFLNLFNQKVKCEVIYRQIYLHQIYKELFLIYIMIV